MMNAPKCGRRFRWGPAAVVAVTLAVSVAACGGGDDPPPTTTTTSTTSTTVATGVADPLTGRTVSPEHASRPALILKIDNDNGKARPQTGLEVADIVFEELVEGGATRFAAVFHSRDANPVGPIRSARSTDLELVANFNRPLFGFSGANTRVVRLLRNEGDFVDMQWDAQPDLYFRRSIHRAPSNLYTNTGDLFARTPEDAQPPPVFFTFRRSGVDPTDGRPIDGLTINWGGRISLMVRWDWDAERRVFLRAQQGTPHTVEAGSQIAAHNVVVQFTAYRNSGDVDIAGAPTPEAQLVGEGEVWVFSGGRVQVGRWVRASVDEVTRYLDQNNRPIALEPGVTWVELARQGSTTPIEFGEAGPRPGTEPPEDPSAN